MTFAEGHAQVLCPRATLRTKNTWRGHAPGPASLCRRCSFAITPGGTAIAKPYPLKRAAIQRVHERRISMIKAWTVLAIAAGAALTLQADDDVSRRDQLRQVPAKAFPGRVH